MQAIIQTADDSMYFITRGCSQVCTVNKMRHGRHFFLMDADCGRQTSGGGGKLNADTCGQGGGQPIILPIIGKILWMSFMDGP